MSSANDAVAAQEELPGDPSASTAQAEWFGHPKGLYVLFFTEMWERFSYYGMRALLVLYMTKVLIIRADQGMVVFGYAGIRDGIQWLVNHLGMSGTLSVQALSSQIYGLYTGFVYFTPFFGGILADRVFGQRKSVYIGGVLMAIGHFLMAVQSMFFPALLFLILGNGCFKPNISTQISQLYPPGDPRRDRAFSIFYVGINTGAFLSPLVCGTLGQSLGWHFGFGAAGVGMLLGLAGYIWSRRYVVFHPTPQRTPVTHGRAVGAVALYLTTLPLGIGALLFLLTLPRIVPGLIGVAVAAAIVGWISRLPRDDRSRVVVLAVSCGVVTAFWSVYEQQGNTLQLWADVNTRWRFGSFTAPSTWFQAFNPFLIFLLTPVLTWLWGRQAARNGEPGSLTKMAIGATLLGLGFVVMIAAAAGQPMDVKRSVGWLFASTVVYTVGELYLSPIGLSFVTKVAPARMVARLMGVWFFATALGEFLAGQFAALSDKIARGEVFHLLRGEADFFLVLVVFPIVVAVALGVMTPWLKRRMHGRDV